jgi:hypothetical protein
MLIKYILGYPQYLEAISSICYLRRRRDMVSRDPLKSKVKGTWEDNIEMDHIGIGREKVV